MQYPGCVMSALNRIKNGETLGQAVSWQFFQCMDKKDRDDMDAWLVQVKHPLAYEPRSQQYRFRALVVEAAEKYGVAIRESIKEARPMHTRDFTQLYAVKDEVDKTVYGVFIDKSRAFALAKAKSRDLLDQGRIHQAKVYNVKPNAVQDYVNIAGGGKLGSFYVETDLFESIDHPKRALGPGHAPDPARSRAARQSARNPETKRKQAEGQRKHEQSTAARNFHRKLGRFNARMPRVRSEGSYRACVLALNEFYAAQPPRTLLAEANRIRAAMTDGTHPVATFKSALIQLERMTEGKTTEVRLHRFDEADAHIASKRSEAIALENDLGRMGKEADKVSKAFYAVSGMGYGPAHGYDRYVGRTSPNVVTFYCKLDGVFGKLPELADPEVLTVIVGEENEYALDRLKEITGTRWFQVGRSGGHLLTDLGPAPSVSDDSTAGWDSEPGAEDSAPSERVATEIKYLKEASGVNDDPEDAGSWVAYVDDLDAVKAGLGEWIAWVNQRVEKLNKVAAYIKTYLDGLPDLLLQSIEANGYELADPSEWKKYFKTVNPNPPMDESYGPGPRTRSSAPGPRRMFKPGDRVKSITGDYKDWPGQVVSVKEVPSLRREPKTIQQATVVLDAGPAFKMLSSFLQLDESIRESIWDDETFVKYHGKYWRVDPALPKPIGGRLSLISLSDSSSGVDAPVAEVFPAEPEQVASIKRRLDGEW